MIDIQEINTECIDTQSSNIRTILDGVEELTASIQAHGQLEPGTGWWEDKMFRLATGHRRAEACRRLGIPVLARVIEPLSGTDLIEYQLVENIQAEALRPFDLEEAVAQLLQAHGSQKVVGKRLGKSASWVSTVLGARIARESISTTVSESSAIPEISTSAAAKFNGLKDEENRQAAYDEALRRNGGEGDLPGKLVKEVVDEYKENEIRDVQAYIWKLQQERVRLVRKRADIEAEIDRLDAKIQRLERREKLGV
ncbi:MAG: ParB N-terminal domain-containing protein [Spirochaetales bacterium]|nr:ParB N-terminal domain-containing protein [Spirochaetales bacterium]